MNITNEVKNIWGFITKNFVAVIIFTIMLIWLYPNKTDWQIIKFVTLMLALAVISTQWGSMLMTHFRHTKDLMKGTDGEMDKEERIAALKLQGDIFKGVCLLIGLVILGI